MMMQSAIAQMGEMKEQHEVEVAMHVRNYEAAIALAKEAKSPCPAAAPTGAAPDAPRLRKKVGATT